MLLNIHSYYSLRYGTISIEDLSTLLLSKGMTRQYSPISITAQGFSLSLKSARPMGSKV